MVNVLETVTCEKYPVIEQIKKAMIDNGAIGSMMSGSGPTVFGFFSEYKEGLHALKFIKNKLELNRENFNKSCSKMSNFLTTF